MTTNNRAQPIPLGRRAFAVGAAATAGLSLAAIRGARAQAGATPTPGPAGTPGATPAGTPGATPAGTPGASGPTILVRVEYVGGFVTPDTNLTAVPTYQLSDDRREISQGAQILIYPPPALPSLQSATLTDVGVRVILDAAREAGLTGSDQEYINPNVPDLPNQIITVTVDGRTVTTTTHGLDQLDPADASELAAARDRIQSFLALIANPASLRETGQVAEPETSYDFTELQFVAIPAASFPAAAEVSTLEGVQPGEPVVWPLDTPLAEVGQPLDEAVGGKGYAAVFPGARVETISGGDLATVRPLAEQANRLTIWQSDGADWVLLLRPLLPGEIGNLARPAKDDDQAMP